LELSGPRVAGYVELGTREGVYLRHASGIHDVLTGAAALPGLTGASRTRGGGT
jgi:hypothetical protein